MHPAKILSFYAIAVLAFFVALMHHNEGILSSSATLCGDLETAVRESVNGVGNLRIVGETVVEWGLWSGVKDGSGNLVWIPIGEIRLSKVYVNGDACVFEMERDVKRVGMSETSEESAGTGSTDGLKVKHAGAVRVSMAKFYGRWIREMSDRAEKRQELVDAVKESLSE